MRRLLNQTENRQLLLAEILQDNENWITLFELSKILGCSVRVLKDDLAHFKNNITELPIETSNNGIRLNKVNNRGLKRLYQYILYHSTAYNLLEIIFLEDRISVVNLIERLYVSSSTIYRLIDQINEIMEERNFKIETNPCRIVGSESEIRYFFYNYFHEKYSGLEWPYINLDENGVDLFLKFFIDFSHMETDFAYYNIFKTVSAVNLMRYKQGYFIDHSDILINFDEIIPDLSPYQEDFAYFEANNHVKVNNTLIQQIFTPYISEKFSLNYERLIEKTKVQQDLSIEVTFLNDMLENLSKTHQLSLKNKETVLINTINAAYLEYKEPRSGYILHNYNQEFALKIKSEFPHFYEDLYQSTKNFRKIMKKPLTDDGIYFIMHIIFIFWEDLLPELRRKFDKIKILVISDCHVSHSETIKDVIEYEFNEQIVVDVFSEMKLDHDVLKQLPYDLIVANFPLPALENQRTVYVEDLPTFFDLAKIRKQVDDIILERMT